MTTFRPRHTDPDNVTDRGKVERVKLSGSGDSNEMTEWVSVPVLESTPTTTDHGKAPAYNDTTGRFELVDTVTVPLPPAQGGVPAGGATGQVLKKNSNTDYDYSWAADATSGGGSAAVATDTIWDAKGDLVAGTAADTAARVPVGANGQALFADSAATAGVGWAWTVPLPKPTSTSVQMTSHGTASMTATLNRVMYVPLWTVLGHSYAALGVRVAAASASGVVRIGLYAAAADGLPGALITDGGTTSTTSTGARWVSISHTAKTPVVWVAVCPQTDATGLTLYGPNNNTIWTPFTLRNPSNGENRGVWYENSVSGALPSTATPTGPADWWDANVTAMAY